MKCLMCGSDMYLVRDQWTDAEKRKKIDNETDLLNFDWDKNIEEKEIDESEWWACSGNNENKHQCFGDNYPLVRHGVFKGLKSAPGDSWSLTWLK